MADEPDKTAVNTAARPGAQRVGVVTPGAGTSASSPEPGSSTSRSRTWLRVLVAIIAAAVIAFCAWSMSEYANGRDPLAFLGTSATEDADAAAQQVADAAANAGEATGTAHALTQDDIAAQLASLTFDGQDVSVPSDQASVVLTGGNAWVEQVSADDAATLVDRTAQRAAALAAWVGQRDSGIASVTWICEDGQGVVRMVAFYTTGVDALGDTAALLAKTAGYLISEDTYAALNAPAFARTAGEVPTLPDGSQLVVDAAVEEASSGEASASSSDGGTSAKLVSVKTNSNSGSSSSSNGSSSGSSSTTGGSGSSGSTQPATITVKVSANGSTRNVTVAQGATALDATRAAFSVTTKPNRFGSGSWVWVIDGVGTVDEPSHGWTYSVDGSSPSVMSDCVTVHDGSTVVWKYV